MFYKLLEITSFINYIYSIKASLDQADLINLQKQNSFSIYQTDINPIINQTAMRFEESLNKECLKINGDLNTDKACKELENSDLKNVFIFKKEFDIFNLGDKNLKKTASLKIERSKIKILKNESDKDNLIEDISFYRNRIKRIEKFVFKNMNKLRKIRFSFQAIKNIEEEMELLSNIDDLDLTCNRIVEFPSFIKNYTFLTRLTISRNGISHLPDYICKLKRLEVLDLSDNKIDFWPSTVEKLKNLEYLDLSENKIMFLPERIKGLQKLSWLNLSSNQIFYIPFSVLQLKSLESLDLSYNQLASIKQEIIAINKINFKYFNLSGNVIPLIGEGFNLGLLELKHYFKDKLIVDDLILNKISKIKEINDAYEILNSKNIIKWNYSSVNSVILPEVDDSILDDRRYIAGLAIQCSKKTDERIYEALTRYVDKLYYKERNSSIQNLRLLFYLVLKEIIVVCDTNKTNSKNKGSVQALWYSKMLKEFSENFNESATDVRKGIFKLYAMTFSQNSSRFSSFEIYVQLCLYFSKNLFFKLAVSPLASKNKEQSINYWVEKLYNELGLRANVSCSKLRKEDDVFDDNSGCVIYAFYSKFTPQIFIKNLLLDVNKSEEINKIAIEYFSKNKINQSQDSLPGNLRKGTNNSKFKRFKEKDIISALKSMSLIQN